MDIYSPDFSGGTLLELIWGTSWFKTGHFWNNYVNVDWLRKVTEDKHSTLDIKNL